MADFIVSFIVGVICIVIGISNIRGNISSLHSYHRKRVSEEDIIPFGKRVGCGTIIIGVAVDIFSILSAITQYTENQVFIVAGMVIMFAGIAVGIGITFQAMIKYNKGIF